MSNEILPIGDFFKEASRPKYSYSTATLVDKVNSDVFLLSGRPLLIFRIGCPKSGGFCCAVTGREPKQPTILHAQEIDIEHCHPLCVAVGLHAVESDQLDSVVEICLFQFRIEKVVFEDHNLVELPEQRKEFFRMKVFLVRRVAVNPDQFANSLCDDLADALVEPFWINAGNFKKKRTGCGSPRSGSPEHRSDIRARRIFRSRKCRSDRWRRRA